MPRTLSEVVGMKAPSWVGTTAGPWGTTAGLKEMEQNAGAQLAGAKDLDGLSEELPPAQSGQPSMPPIEVDMLWPSSCAIAIGAKAIACPASPMPKATSSISARRRASASSLMDGEVTSAVFGFKPRLTADPAHDLVFRMDPRVVVAMVVIVGVDGEAVDNVEPCRRLAGFTTRDDPAVATLVALASEFEVKAIEAAIRQTDVMMTHNHGSGLIP
jgi:hypothetical protein